MPFVCWTVFLGLHGLHFIYPVPIHTTLGLLQFVIIADIATMTIPVRVCWFLPLNWHDKCFYLRDYESQNPEKHNDFTGANTKVELVSDRLLCNLILSFSVKGFDWPHTFPK